MPRHIFLTGQPGCGKSTLIQRVLDRSVAACGQQLQLQVNGFYTEEVRGPDGDRSGFDVVTMDGKRGILARAGHQAGHMPAVGKYSVDVQSFEGLALPALASGSEGGPGTLIVVDEIGKMELLSRRFYPAVRAALRSGALVLGTIPAPPAEGRRPLREVEEVRGDPNVDVITVTRANRDALVDQITRQLLEQLRQ